MENFKTVLHIIAQGIEAVGVLFIALGGIVTFVIFIKNSRKDGQWVKNLDKFRTGLAKAILLGLEFLVAADIVGTVTVTPSLTNLYALKTAPLNWC